MEIRDSHGKFMISMKMVISQEMARHKEAMKSIGNHRSFCVWRESGPQKGLKGRKLVLGQISVNSVDLMELPPFLLQMQFPWSRSSKAYETYGILGVLGRPLG